MKLGKDSVSILKEASKKESISWETAMNAFPNSPHLAFALDELEFLEENGLILLHSEQSPKGYEKVTVRITPKGLAELQDYEDRKRDQLITRVISILALIISLIALIKP